jgi:membrane fusion protein (multidrug efflux system)
MDESPRSTGAFRWIRPLLAALAGLAICWTAWALFQQYQEDQTGNASQPVPGLPASAPVDVQVVPPTRRDVVYAIALPANIAPWYQTTLYAKTAGYLKWIGADKGDWVTKGQVLAVIDSPEVEEQYHQAVAEYKIKKLTYERLAQVWKETPDVIAKQDVDVAYAAYEGAKHYMEQRTALLDYTKIRAPYAGVITARFADPGELIQIASTSAAAAIPLFTIMDISTVRVYTNIPQDDAPLVKPDTPTIVTVKELNDRQFKGTVTRSTLALDPSTRTMLVEIDIPNPDRILQPGTFAEATLVLRNRPDALVVPPSALVTSNGTQSVFIADQERARLVPIRTGISDGRWIEIVEGLNGNEAVVVVGKSGLTEGTPLRVSPYNLPEGKQAVQKFERRSSGAGPTPPYAGDKNSLPSLQIDKGAAP